MSYDGLSHWCPHKSPLSKGKHAINSNHNGIHLTISPFSVIAIVFHCNWICIKFIWEKIAIIGWRTCKKGNRNKEETEILQSTIMIYIEWAWERWERQYLSSILMVWILWNVPFLSMVSLMDMASSQYALMTTHYCSYVERESPALTGDINLWERKTCTIWRILQVSWIIIPPHSCQIPILYLKSCC
jgi:hypothetical protein